MMISSKVYRVQHCQKTFVDSSFLSPPQAPVAGPLAESLAGLEPAAEPRVALAEGVGERVQARRAVPLARARLVAPGAHRRLQ